MKLPSRGIIVKLVLFRQRTHASAYEQRRSNSSENQIEHCNVNIIDKCMQIK